MLYKTGDTFGVVLNSVFLVWDVGSIIVGAFTFGAGTAAMQSAKIGIKAGIKAGARAIKKKALDQLGKLGFKQLNKQVLKEGLSQLANKIKCYVVRACFTEDTLISTSEGLVPIKEIKLGDLVYSYNTEYNTTSLKRVTCLFDREVDEILEIITENEIIETTKNHPFYINGEFKDAEQIEVGDYLYSKEKQFVKVVSLNYVFRVCKVYTFEVEDDHCYFVGVAGILVLNACSNHRKLFLEAYPRFKKIASKIEVHHRLPQEWFTKNVLKGNKNNLSNLVALGKSFHRKVISPAWTTFRKEFPNPTQEQIYKKAKELDKLIEEHIRKRGY